MSTDLHKEIEAELVKQGFKLVDGNWTFTFSKKLGQKIERTIKEYMKRVAQGEDSGKVWKELTIKPKKKAAKK